MVGGVICGCTGAERGMTSCSGTRCCSMEGAESRIMVVPSPWNDEGDVRATTVETLPGTEFGRQFIGKPGACAQIRRGRTPSTRKSTRTRPGDRGGAWCLPHVRSNVPFGSRSTDTNDPSGWQRSITRSMPPWPGRSPLQAPARLAPGVGWADPGVLRPRPMMTARDGETRMCPRVVCASAAHVSTPGLILFRLRTKWGPHRAGPPCCGKHRRGLAVGLIAVDLQTG